MLEKSTKRDLSYVMNMALEVFETWENTKKEKGSKATLAEFLVCLNFCAGALAKGDSWQKSLTKSLEIDDGYLDEGEAYAISDIRGIIEDTSRLKAVQDFFQTFSDDSFTDVIKKLSKED